MPLATRKGSPTPGNRATNAANKGVALDYARGGGGTSSLDDRQPRDRLRSEEVERGEGLNGDIGEAGIVVVVAAFYPKQIEFDILES
ncbi:hypothetical protein K0M31_003754 [Melipona bicolor]|uniref:Uncharacterized protein n=1 Tax=Melipona bicolor TaxID=60889 RepID=A0AA40FY75_9HYME|nr:hypothetical protein K0M31_003754 [Melipona bicolor]